jgi:hypothetical protein
MWKPFGLVLLLTLSFLACSDQSNSTEVNPSLQTANTRKDTLNTIMAKADTIKVHADELYSILEKYKVDLIGNEIDAHGLPKNKDNQDMAHDYFVIVNNGEKGKILESKIDQYRTLLIDVVKDSIIANRFNLMLSTEDSLEYKWIEIICEHLPLVAVVANLTLLQTYIRHAEAESVEYLAREVEKM